MSFSFPSLGWFDASQWLLVAAIFVMAGFVKGTIGMGLPTLGMGLLGLLMAPAQAAALLLVPSLLTNLWQMLAGGQLLALCRRLWRLLAGVVGGTWLGSVLVPMEEMRYASVVLGVALSCYALAGLLAFRFSVSVAAERRLSPWIGAATGIVTAATGVFVMPAVPYLQALNLDKEELIQALGLSFTVSTLALGASLAHTGVLHAEVAGASLLALLPAMVGMLGGQWLRAKLAPALFRRCFFYGLLG